MTPETLTLQGLFGPSVRYLVPLYLRRDDELVACACGRDVEQRPLTLVEFSLFLLRNALEQICGRTARSGSTKRLPDRSDSCRDPVLFRFGASPEAGRMERNECLDGQVVQWDRPHWAPLTSALGESIAAWFMWMHEIQLADGSALHAYKHVTTRRYLHLDGEGRAFVYGKGGRYSPILFASAVASVLSGCERTLPAPHLRELESAVKSAQASDAKPA